MEVVIVVVEVVEMNVSDCLYVVRGKSDDDTEVEVEIEVSPVEMPKTED